MNVCWAIITAGDDTYSCRQCADSGGPDDNGCMGHAPQLADVVDDAQLVAVAAVRQSVKNLLLTRALRDAADFDAGWFATAVRHEFEVLAAEKEADARRLDEIIRRTRRRRGTARHAADYRAGDRASLQRRLDVSLVLAQRLRELGHDEQTARAIVAEARERALDEISAARAATRSAETAPLGELDRVMALSMLAEDLDRLHLRRMRERT
jgi:hypothetical protein